MGEIRIIMSSLLIIGAGSFSVEVDEIATLLGYKNIAFLDDKSTKAIGTMQDICKMRKLYDTAIVALGNNEDRRRYHEALKRYKYSIPILIHPTAFVSADAQLLPGCIVRANAVVSRFAKLGEGVIVNMGSLIDHHCEIEEFSMVLPGAVVRNSVRVASGSWIGANEVVE